MFDLKPCICKQRYYYKDGFLTLSKALTLTLDDVKILFENQELIIKLMTEAQEDSKRDELIKADLILHS